MRTIRSGGPTASSVYLAGLKSPLLKVADPTTNAVVQEVGPFASVIRPFTINGSQTKVYVNVNDLLGFEVGDLKTGKLLQHVEVPGFEKGDVKRHGCPSHGIALSPDEKELWLADGHNSAIHVFDMTVQTPRLIADDQGPRSAGLDHLEPRWEARVAVDRRDHRREDEEDCCHADR